MMRRLAALSMFLFAGAPAQGFEWDDGHGAFPFEPVTTRHYEVAHDRVPPKGEAGRRHGALYEVSTTRPTPSVVLRSTFRGETDTGETNEPHKRAGTKFRGN
jgi:hypothetical protein